MSLDDSWFTEVDKVNNFAFSLKIKQKLHEEQSPYQKIEVYETESFGNLLTLDGLTMLTDRDNFVYHEMMTHPILFTHPDPKQVVIIGGGDCGTLKEVLKHQAVEKAYQIDIDERVTRISEQFFPDLCTANNDPRANLLFEDGIKWMQNALKNSVDVIIVDSTDPIGPGEVLFSEQFYAQCRRVLKPDGLYVQQSESPLFQLKLLKNMHKSLQASGFAVTHTFQFFQCTYPSGWWTGTLAGEGDLTKFRHEDAKNRAFPTRYYTPEIHSASFVLPNFLLEALA